MDGGATEMAEVVVVAKACVPEVVPTIKLLNHRPPVDVDHPLEIDPPSDVAGFAVPEAAPPKPANNALQQVRQ